MTIMMGPKPRPAIERFEAHYIPEPNSGCHIWIGGLQTSGYGNFKLSTERKVDGAHRAAWKLFKGPIPDGLFVLHKCDNRMCVNPDHLFLGTNTDNMQDAKRKGRLPTHETNHYQNSKTHCRNGHEYTADNTYSRPGSHERICRICRREIKRRFAFKHKGA